MKEHRRGLYFNIAAFYGYRGEIYIDLNLIMILLALLNLYIFKGFSYTPKQRKEPKKTS